MSDKLRAAAQAAYGIEKARQWVRGTLGTAHLKEFDDFIKEGL